MMVMGYCSLQVKHRQELKAIDNSYTALLTDTLKAIKNNKDTFWIQPISTISPEDLVKLEIFDQLDSNQQVLINDLKEKKDLLAALNVHVIATREENQKLRDSLNFWVSKDTFMAKDGTIITFKDSIGGLQYTETITLSDTIDKKAKYTLSFTPNLEVTKASKYSIEGHWSFDGLSEFNEINVINGYSYYKQIKPEPKLKPGVIKGLKIGANIVGYGLVSYGSYKIGYRTGFSIGTLK